MDTIDQEIAKVQSEIDKVESEIEKIQEAFDQKIEKIQEAIDQVSSKYEAIDQEIKEIQEATDRAASKYEAACTDRDKEYWLGEKAHLRNKEAQLRDEKARLQNKEAQLRDEKARLQNKEAQLRDEKARLQDKEARLRDQKARLEAQTAGPVISKQALLDCCKEATRFIADGGHDTCGAQDFEKKFPSAIKPVFSLKDQPCMLWHNDAVAVDGRLTGQLSKDGEITVLLSPSGSGKTRQLIELASRRFCLYFTGKRQGLTTAGGSDDVYAASRWLSQVCKDMTQVESLAVSCCVRALLLARLYILCSVRVLKPKLTPREWVFFQLEFPGVGADVFNNVAIALLQFVPSHERLGLFHTCVSEALTEIAARVEWNGFAILDEAQFVNGYMEGRFPTTSEVPRSMLNQFVYQLLDTPRVVKSLFVSGTGAGMLAVREAFSSGSLKPFPMCEVYRLDGFEGKSDMTKYLEEFIDISQLDMTMIGMMYAGRRRWLVTALERFIVEEHDPGTETEFFLRFCGNVCTRPGSELKLLRSVYDDAKKFWDVHVGLRQFVIDIIFCMYMGEKMAVVVPPSRTAMYILECGLGYIYEESYGNFPEMPEFPLTGSEPQFKSSYHNVDVSSAKKVLIAEDMIVKAMLAVIPDSCKTAHFCRQAQTSSPLGLSFEKYSLESIAMGFENQQPALALGYTDTVPNVYLQKYELLRPLIPTTNLIKKLSDDYTIGHWVDDVEKGESFSPILHTGPATDFGPDAMFIQRDVTTGKKLCYLLQHKTGQNVGYHVAMGTLNAWNLYANSSRVNRKDREGVEKLQEWCKGGYVQLLVTTHLHEGANRHRANKGDCVTTRSQCKMASTTPPLVGVIAEHNAAAFLDEGIMSVIEKVKGEAMRKRRKTR